MKESVTIHTIRIRYWLKCTPQIERFDDIQNDLPRLAWLTPNIPEPLLVWCIRSAIYDPTLN